MKNQLPSVWISCIPLLVLVILISVAVSLFGDNALNGASQLVLLLSSSVCVMLGLSIKSMTFRDFEKTLTEKIASVSIALVILLLIGALSGTWMVSGIVPTLIYYGMYILQPAWFLVSACVICAVVSLMVGSSWTTVATIGIALMGLGQALGFSIGWTAGAIISGAYFGDKMSPLSDTTVIASSMYKDAYLDNGYEPKLLSRTIEDSATVTSPIIPWTTCGMTQANVLGVSTLTYAPYCIFNYLSPVVTVLMALRVKRSSFWSNF